MRGLRTAIACLGLFALSSAFAADTLVQVNNFERLRSAKITASLSESNARVAPLGTNAYGLTVASPVPATWRGGWYIPIG